MGVLDIQILKTDSAIMDGSRTISYNILDLYSSGFFEPRELSPKALYALSDFLAKYVASEKAKEQKGDPNHE